MQDTGKIILGLAIFVALLASPFWFNATIGSGAQPPELEKAKGDACVMETEYMRANHMDLIVTWRDEVVRDANREKVRGLDGKFYEKSLSKTCLSCHANKAEFCDKCHNYSAVDPVCWDCHVDKWENK